MDIIQKFEQLIETIQNHHKADAKQTQELMLEISTLYQQIQESLEKASDQEKEELTKKLPAIQGRLEGMIQNLTTQHSVDQTALRNLKEKPDKVDWKNLPGDIGDRI